MKHCETIWREALSDLLSSGLSLRKYCQERHLVSVRSAHYTRISIGNKLIDSSIIYKGDVVPTVKS